MNCRFCNNKVSKQVLDLGKSHPSNAYLKDAYLFEKEKYFPLKLFLCEICFLVQTEDYNLPDELFTEVKWSELIKKVRTLEDEIYYHAETYQYEGWDIDLCNMWHKFWYSIKC